MGVNLSSFYNKFGTVLSEMPCAMPVNASDRGKGKSNKCKNKNPYLVAWNAEHGPVFQLVADIP